MSEPTLPKPPGPTDTPFVNSRMRRGCGWHISLDDARTLERDLNTARAKLTKLSDLIALADQINDTKTDAEVAASATFNEALAQTAGTIAEEERDAWREVATQLKLALANDGMKANNPLSHLARVAALRNFDAFEKDCE